MVNETKLGTLEFCGPVNFSGGTWAGVELDEAEGKNDGTVNGVTYFNCEPGFGVMVPTNKIEKVILPLMQLDAIFLYYMYSVNSLSIIFCFILLFFT